MRLKMHPPPCAIVELLLDVLTRTLSKDTPFSRSTFPLDRYRLCFCCVPDIPRIPRPIPRIPRFTAATLIPRHSARSGLFRAIPRPVSFRAEPQIPRGAESPQTTREEHISVQTRFLNSKKNF